MLTIDLLKGTGVPIKNSPGTVALQSPAFRVAAGRRGHLAGSFEFNRTIVAMERSGIEKMQEKLTEYADEVRQVQQWNTSTEQTRKNLAEVARGLGRHLQWSQILQACVEQMPDSIALREMKLIRSATRKKGVVSEETKKPVNKTIINRILTLQVYGPSSWETDEAVRQYLDRLGQIPEAKRRMKDIRIVSQQTEELDRKPITIHTIECEIQPQE